MQSVYSRIYLFSFLCATPASVARARSSTNTDEHATGCRWLQGHDAHEDTLDSQRCTRHEHGPSIPSPERKRLSGRAPRRAFPLATPPKRMQCEAAKAISHSKCGGRTSNRVVCTEIFFFFFFPSSQRMRCRFRREHRRVACLACADCREARRLFVGCFLFCSTLAVAKR